MIQTIKAKTNLKHFKDYLLKNKIKYSEKNDENLLTISFKEWTNIKGGILTEEEHLIKEIIFKKGKLHYFNSFYHKGSITYFYFIEELVNHFYFYENGVLHKKDLVINGFTYIGDSIVLSEIYNKNFVNYIEYIGTELEFFPNGKLKLVATYDEFCNLGGPYKEYYENGQLKIEAEYSTYNRENFQYCNFEKAQEDNPDITYKEYFNKVHFSVYVGPYKEYYENGQLKVEAEYSYSGDYNGYDPYYKTLKEIKDNYFENFGKLQGTYREYDEKGNLKLEAEYDEYGERVLIEED